MRAYVKEAAVKARVVLKDEMKGKLIYLKFDCATRLYTNYLGLNARFTLDNKRVTRTLEVIDTKSQHRALNIKEMINDTIKLYDVPLENVLLSVTDNATNMVKTVDLLNEVFFL